METSGDGADTPNYQTTSLKKICRVASFKLTVLILEIMGSTERHRLAYQQIDKLWAEFGYRLDLCKFEVTVTFRGGGEQKKTLNKQKNKQPSKTQ